ncbi:galactoside alpha-(1,2)-fucosyltransferase 1 isoform X3 [Procambarus clarkii]|uniref:galactoside alpha-(1,2)-fucosyltransferase 1 isoform X3 n=1 Tax=Procambarus clarkii TaxID=6728 RepID=UPI00374344B1
MPGYRNLIMSRKAAMVIAALATLLYIYHLLLYPTNPVSDLHQSSTSNLTSPFQNSTRIEGVPSIKLSTSGSAASHCLPLPQYQPLPPDNLHNCSLPYVSMNNGGRLGNKICQYMSLALLRSVFGIRVGILKNMNNYLRKIFPKLSLPVEDPKCFHGTPSRDNFSALYRNLSVRNSASGRNLVDSKLHPYLLSESVYIYNYPCPWNLLLPLRDQLRQELVFHDAILNKAKMHLNHAVKSLLNNATKNITIITVHVRRTDYLNYIKVNYKLKPLKKTYFQRAFKFFRNRVASPVFAVSSDDPEWCKNNIMDKDVVFVGLLQSYNKITLTRVPLLYQTRLQDTLCKHNINTV